MTSRRERSEAEWEEVYQEDLRTSRAAEARLIWMELASFGAVAVVIVLHFVWH